MTFFNTTAAGMTSLPDMSEGRSVDVEEVDGMVSPQEPPILTDVQRQSGYNILLLVRYVFLALALPVTVCNVIVFSQKRMRNATGVYILGLSAAQIFFLTAHVGLSLWSGLASQPATSFYFCLFNLYAIGFGGVIARRGSYVILCFVSVERLYAILRPLHVKRFFVSKSSVTVMMATYFITTVWHLYVPAKYEVVMALHGPTGSLRLCRSGVTELYLRHKDVNDTFSLAVKILMTYMALILQIVLNVLTVWALRRHNMAAKLVQPSANEEARRMRERQLTVTILLTTVTYVILSLPACLDGLLNMVVADYHEHGRYRNLAHVIYNICLDLQVLSCSVDFFCFFLLSSNYRKTFFSVFPCLRTRGMKQLELESSTEQTQQASCNSSK